MGRLTTLTATAMALLSFLGALPADDAAAEALQEQVIGTWTQVSIVSVRSDGSRTRLFGPNAKGLLVLDRSGHFSIIQVRGDLPNFASGDRASGTAAENRSVVRGSIAMFGTYTVNEEDKAITLHIQGSTYPNWNGSDQKRTFTISGDELTWQTVAARAGGPIAESVWKRLR